jgi:hypothetical protein
MGPAVRPRRSRAGAPDPGIEAIRAADTTRNSSGTAFESTTAVPAKSAVAWSLAWTRVPDGSPLEGTLTGSVKRVVPPAGIVAGREGEGPPLGTKAPEE